MFSINYQYIIRFRQVFFPLILIFLAISCRDDFMSTSTNVCEGIECTVSLNLQSESFSGDNYNATRGMDDVLVDENTVKARSHTPISRPF